MHFFVCTMQMVSHYTVFSDGLWTALGEPCPKSCPRLINALGCQFLTQAQLNQLNHLNNLLNVAGGGAQSNQFLRNALLAATIRRTSPALNESAFSHLEQLNYPQLPPVATGGGGGARGFCLRPFGSSGKLTQSNRLKIKDWLNTINHKWTQLVSSMHCRPTAHQLLNSNGSTMDCSLYGSLYGHCGVLDEVRTEMTEYDDDSNNNNSVNESNTDAGTLNAHPQNSNQISLPLITSTCTLPRRDVSTNLDFNYGALADPLLHQPLVCVDYSTGKQ